MSREEQSRDILLLAGSLASEINLTDEELQRARALVWIESENNQSRSQKTLAYKITF